MNNEPGLHMIKVFLAHEYGLWLDKFDLEKTHLGIYRFLEAAGKSAKSPKDKEALEVITRILADVEREELGIVGSLDRIP